jgi:pimeloyl-ACP methyl ester carboxylesterase
MERVAPELMELIELTDAEAHVGCALGIVQATIYEGVAANAVHPERDALRQEADRMIALLQRWDTRHAQQAMLRRFNPLDAAGQRDWAAIERLTRDERGIRVPLLVVWGERDETLPLSDGRRLLARLPAARLEVLPGVKHSVHQEAVGDVARLLREFSAAGGGAAAP